MSDPQQPQPCGAQPTGAPQPPTGLPQPYQEQPYQGQPYQGQPGQPYPYQGQPAPAHQAPAQAQPPAAPQYPGQVPQYPGGQAAQQPQSYPFSQTQSAAPGQPPQHGGAPYGASPYGTSQPAGNPLGRIAFFLAAGTVALNLLSTLISAILFRTGDYDVAGSLSGVLTILTVLLSVVAVILAVIALRGPGSKIFPAIALGAAGSVFLIYALNWISNLFYLF